MPNAIFKSTFLFNFGQYGWSESYYTEADSAGYATVGQRSARLAIERLNLCPVPIKFVGIRISREDVFRDSRFLPGGLQGTDAKAGGMIQPGTNIPGEGTYHSSADLIDQPVEAFTAILCRLEGGPLHRRALLLRGAPELVIGHPLGGDWNVYANDYPGWNPKMTAFLNALRGIYVDVQLPAWLIKGSPDVNTFEQSILSSTVDVSYPAAMSFTTAAPLFKAGTPPQELQVGDLVQVRGAKKSVGINGFWTILTIINTGAGRTYVMNIANRAVSKAPNQPLGRIRGYAPSFVPIDRAVDERIVKRSTGRPSGLPHGRRSRAR